MERILYVQPCVCTWYTTKDGHVLCGFEDLKYPNGNFVEEGDILEHRWSHDRCVVVWEHGMYVLKEISKDPFAKTIYSIDMEVWIRRGKQKVTHFFDSLKQKKMYVLKDNDDEVVKVSIRELATQKTKTMCYPPLLFGRNKELIYLGDVVRWVNEKTGEERIGVVDRLEHHPCIVCADDTIIVDTPYAPVRWERLYHLHD